MHVGGGIRAALDFETIKIQASVIMQLCFSYKLIVSEHYSFVL